MKKFLASIPIPIAGVSLGFVALGNLLQGVAVGLKVACGILSLLFLILVLAKVIFCFGAVKEDFKSPIVCGVSATALMSIMQLVGYVRPFIGHVATAIWLAAIVLHVVLIVYFTLKFVVKGKLNEVYPTYFITYIGIVVASVTSPIFHMELLGEIIFWAGLVLYAIAFVAVTVRYCKHRVEDASKPLICIYTAPMSLCLTGYIACAHSKSLIMILIMQVLAQMLYLFVLGNLPRLLRLKFYPSYAAFTFPFVITAIALQKTLVELQLRGIVVHMAFKVIMYTEMVIAAIMVCYAAVRYIAYLANCAHKIVRERGVVSEEKTV